MNTNFDAIILGGGVNGCAIARKLSNDGKKVLLIERNTIGCGTSSNSSKLVHGGLRYLETQQFKLVKESLKDRKRLCELYPDQVQMAPFYLPVYRDSPRPGWMIHAGLVIYDFLARWGKQGDSPSASWRMQQVQSPCLPRLDPQCLTPTYQLTDDDSGGIPLLPNYLASFFFNSLLLLLAPCIG
jgi:glycerol-3-phosphate dehydrogenase